MTMTAQKEVTMRRQPARSEDDQVIILNAGIAAIPTAIAFQPTPWQWDLLLLKLGKGYTLEQAEIVDSYVGLYEACRAATELTRRAKLAGERALFVVQRHEPVEELEAVEF